MWEAIAGYAVGRLHEKKVVNDDSLYAQKVLTTQLSYALENPDVFEDEIIDEIGLALSEFSDYLMLIYAGVVTLNEYSENSLRYSEWYYGPQKRILFSPKINFYFDMTFL